MKAKMMNGRGKAATVIILLVMFVYPVFGDILMGVESVNIDPVLPTETDTITFDISGWANQSPSWVEYDELSIDGLTLQLDLYINKGVFAASSEWTYLKPISPLFASTYTLEINVYDYADENLLRDTYPFEFTVVPEPAACLLFGAGLLFVRAFSRKKACL